MRYQLNRSKFLNDKEQEELELKFMAQPDKYLPILLAIKTGARKTELLNLKVSSIDFDKGSIEIIAVKNSYDREIPLEKWVINILKTYIQRGHLESGDKLFKISGPTLSRLWYEMRPVEKKFHSLRHSFAVNFYRNTKNLMLTQQAMGHVQVANTMIYAQYQYEVDEMRNAMFGVA